MIDSCMIMLLLAPFGHSAAINAVFAPHIDGVRSYSKQL